MSIVEEHERAPLLVEEPDRGQPPAPLPADPDAPATTDAPSALHAPDIIGLKVLEAHALARQSGLRLVVRVWETKLGPWGMVLSQSPEPGARIQPRARLHAVTASRPHLAVPDVLGLRTEAALEALRRGGLEPYVTTARGSRLVEPDRVVATRPAAGALVAHGSRVALTVSRGRVPGGEGRRESREG